MQKLTILCISLLLCSCQDNIITAPTDKAYRIEDIEIIESGVFDTDALCRYRATTNIGYMFYDDVISFCDTIGKYKIGDFVYADFKTVQFKPDAGKN